MSSDRARPHAASGAWSQRCGEPLASLGHPLVLRPDHRDELGDHGRAGRGIDGLEDVAKREPEPWPDPLQAGGTDQCRRKALEVRPGFRGTAKLTQRPSEIAHGGERIAMFRPECALSHSEHAFVESLSFVQVAPKHIDNGGNQLQRTTAPNAAAGVVDVERAALVPPEIANRFD